MTFWVLNLVFRKSFIGKLNKNKREGNKMDLYLFISSSLIMCLTGYLWDKGLVKRPTIKRCLCLIGIISPLFLESFFEVSRISCVGWSVSQVLNLIFLLFPTKMQFYIKNSIVRQ